MVRILRHADRDPDPSSNPDSDVSRGIYYAKYYGGEGGWMTDGDR